MSSLLPPEATEPRARDLASPLPGITPLLEVRGLVKRFGPVLALDRVDFACASGEVHALLGENGAGKSTLMHVLSGLHAADAGEMRLAGEVVHWHSAEQARRAGIAMVHQHFMLVPTMTVAENLALARGELGLLRRARARREVLDLASRHGLKVGDPDRRIADLPVGERQRVEILKALIKSTRLLVLDEPTTVLTPDEVAALFALLRSLLARGTAVVIVTHRLSEVLAIADRVTVLRRGRVVGGGPARGFDERSLAALMVRDGEPCPPPAGRRSAPPAPGATGARRLAVPLEASPSRSASAGDLLAEGLHALDERGAVALDGLSLRVAPGELLVVAGVEGNGQAELVDALAGIGRETLREFRGRVSLSGREVTSAAAAREAGLAVVPPDRNREGIVADLELWENLLLASDLLARQASHGLLSRAGSIRAAAQLVAEFGIRPPDPRLSAGALSGGNQQRLVLARELGRRSPSALVAANPTRGLDLAATAAVRERLRSLAAAGTAVLVLSTDLDEVEELGGRVVVLYRGRLLEPREQPPGREVIGRLMAGAREAA